MMGRSKTKRFKIELIDGSIMRLRAANYPDAIEKAETMSGKPIVTIETY
nr:MAG TPA: hypothetical protein [Caudoviricetes sp.]